ncbi:hypothetical protein AB0B15_34090 [Streptomyces sp. NPDC045456]|uniref:hypothetical protein n=1 Tax=Streptomyces sp. NPDC045456 TaxID=3155254 RepID=UPI0033E3B1D2
MITYEQLYNVPVSSLSWAADQWDIMINKLKAMDEACTNEVVKPFGRAGWTSFDGTSAIAQVRVAAVDQEFSDALQEAKGIRGVLHDAYEELKKHQDDLRRIADEDAKRDGLFVSAKGEITPRHDLSQDSGAQHDPDGQEAIAAQNRKIEALKARIEKVLNDAAETDRAAATALRHNLGNDNADFNGKAVTSIDADEAARASGLLGKLDKDGKLSQHDLNELERVMEHNQHDPEFNRMLLNKLGPKKTLELAEELDRIHGDEDVYQVHRKQYATIQQSLANGIGAANQDQGFSEQWRKDMRALGTEQIGDAAANRHTLGYQALTGLLKHGDGSRFPAHMTTGLTDDIIEAERKDPGLWDEHDQVTRGTDIDAVAVQDPVDDMLGIMSKDPDTATRYLDPAHDGGKNRLEYLLDKRDWPNLEVMETTGRGDVLDTKQVEATNSRTGLGNVLEAATTGAQPGHEHTRYGGHTAGQARIMHDTIERLDSDNGGDKIPHNMQKPLARALSDYTEDTHNIIAGGHDGYGSVKDGRPDAWHREGEDKYHIGVPESSVLRVLRGVSDDPENYAQIYEAERFYAAEQMAKSPTDPGGAHANWETPARDAGNVLGAYNAIGTDVILDDRDGKKQWADDTAKYVYHGAGIPLTAVPVVGDTAQRLLDQSTYDWSKDVKASADAKATDEGAEKNAAGVDGTYDLIDRWATVRGQDTESNPIRQVKQEAEQSYGTSRSSALGVLRGEH